MAPKPKHLKTTKGKEHCKSKEETKEETIKLDHCALNFPEVLAIDHEFSLPKYTAVVSRPDGAVSMEDVDRIQLELEALLSAATIRRKTLGAEIKLINSIDKRRSKPVTQVTPGSPGKPGRSADRPAKKFKDSQGRAKEVTPVKPPKVRVSTAPPGQAPEQSADILPQIKADPCQQLPSPPVKNDVPNKFWAAMEQYCGPITAKDVEMLERLSAEEEDNEEYLTVPPLGKHYTLRWAEEDGAEDGESESDADNQTPAGGKTKGKSEDDSAGLGALTQRLVSGLVEESAAGDDAEQEGKECESVAPRPGLSASAQLSSPGQLERRLRRELESQGLVDDSDGPAAVADDQVLAELERCQARLSTLAAHNAAQLERLLRLARAELQRQQLREKLAATDAQVQEAYQAVAAARQRKKSPSKKEREVAWKALKERDAIIKMMDAL